MVGALLMPSRATETPYDTAQGGDPMRELCGAKTRTGGTCKSPPVDGAKRCRMHGGMTAKAKARAQARMISRTLGDDLIDVDTDPAEALLDLVRWKRAEVLWLRQQVTAKGDHDDPGGRETLTYGLSKHDEGVGPQGPVDQRTFQTEANIWWRLLREAEDQLARYSSLALKAGVEQRQIELQEAHAVMLAQALDRIFEALELTAEQQAKVPEIVPQILRSLPVGGKP